MDIESDLEQVLRRELDGGAAAKLDRTPYVSELSYGRYCGPAPRTAKKAAVMALFYPGREGWCLPLTLRPQTIRPHAGQVSLPGGIIEPRETSSEAALRELHEELGVPPTDVQLVGNLRDLYIFSSDHLVTPWIGMTTKVPQWILQESEVEELIELPVDELLEPTCFRKSDRTVRSVCFRAPYFNAGRHRVWGATCVLLGEILELLRAAQATIGNETNSPK